MSSTVLRNPLERDYCSLVAHITLTSLLSYRWRPSLSMRLTSSIFLAISIPWVNIRDRKGFWLSELSTGFLIQIDRHVCWGSEEVHTAWKEMRWERKTEGAAMGQLQSCFPWPCSDINSQTHRTEKRATKMGVSSRVTQEAWTGGFCKNRTF